MARQPEYAMATTGLDQVRPYKLEGDTLTISGAPAKDMATGEEVVYRIAFQRVANSN